MLDWDDLRFFLAIARHGSLTGTAKDMRVAQSTVGRRLASLEDNLSVRLLHRTPDGYRLTLAGETVRSQAERVEAEALTIEPLSAGTTNGCRASYGCPAPRRWPCTCSGRPSWRSSTTITRSG